jgi:3D (Asp-Asp-Asp) domain-containing protein
MNKLLCIAIATILLSITMVIPTSSTDVVDVTEPVSVTETTTVVETTTTVVETTTEPIETTTEPQTKTMLVDATAYCSCAKCCGKSDGITASGVKAKANHTIAVDKRIIPLGTVVLINGKQYVAEDTGGAIKGNRIDIYFDSHEQALKWGRQQIEIEVLFNA